jgi:hypothetical protein
MVNFEKIFSFDLFSSRHRLLHNAKHQLQQHSPMHMPESENF